MDLSTLDVCLIRIIVGQLQPSISIDITIIIIRILLLLLLLLYTVRYSIFALRKLALSGNFCMLPVPRGFPCVVRIPG
jgi:hypothetical protein